MSEVATNIAWFISNAVVSGEIRRHTLSQSKLWLAVRNSGNSEYQSHVFPTVN